MPKVAAGRRWRLGVIGILLAAMCAAGMLWQTSSEAGGAPLDPQIAAFAKDNQIQLAIALSKETPQRLNGELVVELIGPAGQKLAEARKDLQDSAPLTSHRLNLTRADCPTDQLRVRISFAGRKAEIPLGKVLLVKAHEMSLSGGQEFHAGGPGSLSCEVHGVRSIASTIPLPGSEVSVRLRDKDGKNHDVYKGRTGASGRADVQFDVPMSRPVRIRWKSSHARPLARRRSSVRCASAPMPRSCSSATGPSISRATSSICVPWCCGRST